MPTTIKEPTHNNVIHPPRLLQMDGFDLEYLDIGTGPVILFLHGALTDMHNWDKLIPFLQQNYRCIAPTLPLGGHRHAICGAADLSVKGVARIIEAFIKALKLAPVHVVANDTGGVYAQMLAAEFDSSVRSLVLTNCDALDVFPPKPFATLPKAVNIPGYVRGMAMLFRFSTFVKSSIAMGLLSHSLSANELKRPLRSFVNVKDVQNDFKEVAGAWQSDVTQQLGTALSSFTKPVKIVWGADDVLFPVDLGERLSTRFPNASFEVVTNTRTYIQCDQPAKLAQHITAFISAL